MPPTPRKTPDSEPQPLPPDPQSEQQYFEIARRQADALNTLEEQLARQDEILRELVAQVQQIGFRVEAVENRPPDVDYGTRPPDPTVRQSRPTPYPTCSECGASLPTHYDHCSSYSPPKARAS